MLLRTKGLSRRKKTIVSIIYLVSFVAGTYAPVIDARAIKQKSLEEKYSTFLLETQELRARGHAKEYIGKLIQNPKTAHYFEEGQKYERESKWDKAIEQYKNCEAVPTATESNKVAANILIGNCYFHLSRLDEGEACYRKTLEISKNVSDKNERVLGQSAALGNMGLIYSATLPLKT